MRWMWLGLAVLWSCSDPPEANSEVDKWKRADAGWVIRGTKSQPMLLTNGQLGLTIDSARGMVEADAFRFVESALVKISKLRGPLLDEPRLSESVSWSFDLRSGEFSVEIRADGRWSFYKLVVHPTAPIWAVQLAYATPVDLSTKSLDLAVSAPIESERRKHGELAQTVLGLSLVPGELSRPALLTLVGREGVYGAFAKGEDQLLPASYFELLATSKAFHEDFWKTDIEIDGPAEDQLAIRTMLYYLRRGATPKLPPFGASNAKYRGARFWDAEAWMLPVLAIVDPNKAKAATKWRIGNLGEYVPWEAAVGGKDVTPKEFGKALHVAGWVAWWVNRAKHLGLATEADEKKVFDVVFPQFYKSATDSERGMEIKGVESPDEGRLRDNDLVTNLLAKRVARWAADHGIADGEDLEWFNSIVIPKAADGLPATYDNDLLKGYQQTAALLALYPLEEDFGDGVAEKMFDRYANLTSEVGPAMSQSIHATIAARLGRPGAYARWRQSWQTYTDDAMMFHERRNKQDAYFMTGAAGCLQTVLYGFAGMHIEEEGKAAAASNSLGNGYQVAFRPQLPTEWKSLVLRNITLGSRRATVRIDHAGVSIE